MPILKVHMAKWVIAKSEFLCLQLYKIASYKKPFHDQWYHREDKSESWGHFDPSEIFHPNESCSKCFKVEIGCGWIQCPRVNQRYHEQFFYDWNWLFLSWYKSLCRRDNLISQPWEFQAASFIWWMYSHFSNNGFDYNLLSVLAYFHSLRLLIILPYQNLQNNNE